MDLRAYYARIRKIADVIKDEFVIVSSLQTEDGGKQGALTEVTRSNAARLIVDNRARLATEKEIAEYYARYKSAANTPLVSSDQANAKEQPAKQSTEISQA